MHISFYLLLIRTDVELDILGPAYDAKAEAQFI
jgi:hypothetical protein